MFNAEEFSACKKYDNLIYPLVVKQQGVRSCYFITVGTDGLTVDIYNLVDIRDEMNFELGMKVSTDIKNKDREFCSDLNGFQVCRYYSCS